MRWGGEMREIITFACFLKFGLRKFCFMCYFWLRSWVAGLQSTPPLLCDSSRRTSDMGHQIGHWRVGHRTSDTEHETPDMGHQTWGTGHRTQGTEKAQRQKLKQEVGSNFLMPDVMSGVQYPMSNVRCPISDFRCPVSIIGGSVTFLPDTGHRTIPSNLALCQGEGVLCNPVG